MPKTGRHLVVGAFIALAAILPAAQPVLGEEGWAAAATAPQVVPGPGLTGAVANLTFSFASIYGEACVGTHLAGFHLDTDPITAISVHRGIAGVVGPAALDLVVPDPPDDNSTCTSDLDPSVLDAVVADPDAYYIEVDTVAYPSGAVRGQLAEHDTVTIWAVEVVCPSSVTLPTGPDVSSLFAECAAVGRPGEFPTSLPAGFRWEIPPLEVPRLQMQVDAGGGTQVDLADAQKAGDGTCNPETLTCNAVSMYNWQGLPVGTITMTESTKPKMHFAAAIMVDGGGDLRAGIVDTKRHRVSFETTGADDDVFVYLINQK